MKSMKWASALCCVLFSLPAFSAELASCYGGSIKAKDSAPDTELFVVVDQTTPFDQKLKQSIADNIRPFLKPGKAITVVQFSAFTQGHYTEVLNSGRLDATLDNASRNDISKPVLAKFDQCMNNQPKLLGKFSGLALKKALSGSTVEIQKSDVLKSLQDISGLVKKSNAKHKIVLLASDMLENSTITSFYKNKAVRLIDAEKELKLVKSNSLNADFDQASIYVIGAGLLSQDAQASYRSPQTMQALKAFWEQYFTLSNATLLDFGQPSLLKPIAE